MSCSTSLRDAGSSELSICLQVESTFIHLFCVACFFLMYVNGVLSVLVCPIRGVLMESTLIPASSLRSLRTDQKLMALKATVSKKGNLSSYVNDS